MFSFSCFAAHDPSHKHKRTVRLSGESMGKGLEESSLNKTPRALFGLRTASGPCFIKEGETPNKVGKSMADHARVKRECKSNELDGKYIENSGVILHKDATIRKSLSLGNLLNWEERSLVADTPDDDIEHRLPLNSPTKFSGNANDVKVHSFETTDKCQEPVLFESVQVGDSNLIESEDDDKGDTVVPFIVDYSDATPYTRPFIAKSTSLPRLGSPTLLHVSAFSRSRSAENLIDSRKTCAGLEFGRPMRYEDGDKICVENIADENYNYIDSARHWSVPESYKLKRIEQWVINLQYTGPVEETGKSAPFNDPQEFPILNTSINKPVASKYGASVMLGAEAARTYVSSLNPSATTALLSNLGLLVIPFLSAFVNLKALNLSGNAIVRITSGALPRGLHILNLAKNSITTIEGLRNLSRLRVLDLSYNRILRIGHGLAGCTSLKELYLAGNKISEVEGLHRLLKLNILDLRFNKISTTKCLGQLAANFNCLHALSLEGNPAQKHVGDEQLKKYVLSLLPNLTYYNRQSVKVGTLKDGTDRSARLGIGSHQLDRRGRQEVKNMRKGAHGVASMKGWSHRRDHQTTSNKQVRSAQTKTRTTTTTMVHQLSVSDSSLHKSRSDGNLRVL